MPPKLSSALVHGARRAALRAAARARLPGAMRRAEEPARTLLGTVRATLAGEGPPQASRIEALRHDLAGSRDEVALVDYGAGDPELPLSPEAMYAGRQVRRTVGEISRASKPPFWARLLYNLVRTHGPRRCLELGTSLGLSAAYQAAALAGDGRLVTVEGAAPLADRARGHLERLGLGDRVRVVTGRFQDVLPAVLEEMGTVDYAFIDGHHDERATLDYFARLHPRLSAGALLVFDDVAWSRGMRSAWSALQADDRIRVSLDLGPVGVCVAGGAGPRQRIRLPLG